MAYNLRNHERINYRAIENPALPRDRATRTQGSQRLYELEIVEEDDYTGRVKVHYIGYEYDEWRNKEDVVVIQPENQGALHLEYWLTLKYSVPRQ